MPYCICTVNRGGYVTLCSMCLDTVMLHAWLCVQLCSVQHECVQLYISIWHLLHIIFTIYITRSVQMPNNAHTYSMRPVYKHIQTMCTEGWWRICRCCNHFLFCSLFFCNHNLLHMPNGFPCHITSIFNTKFSVYRMLCIFEFSLVKTSLEIRSEHERAINCATDDRTENAITTKQSRSFRNNSAGMRNRYSSRHCNGSKQEQQQPNKTPILCATYSSKHTTKHRVSVWKMEIETLQEVGNVPYFSFLSIPCYLFFFFAFLFSLFDIAIHSMLVRSHLVMYRWRNSVCVCEWQIK